MPNLRYTARGRPHILQRRSRRTENFGVRFAFAIFDFFATIQPANLQSSKKLTHSKHQLGQIVIQSTKYGFDPPVLINSKLVVTSCLASIAERHSKQLQQLATFIVFVG